MFPLNFVSFAGYATAATGDGMPQWIPVVLGLLVLAGVVVLSIAGKKRDVNPDEGSDAGKHARKDAGDGDDASAS